VKDVTTETPPKLELVGEARPVVAHTALSLELTVIDTRNSTHVYAVTGASAKRVGEPSGDVSPPTSQSTTSFNRPMLQHRDIKHIALAMASVADTKA
jgi:hypothetical protein